MLLIDTHTHLYAEEFDADRSDLINKAITNGINKFYLPNIDSTSIGPMLALENEYPLQCFAMMGLHPCSVNKTFQSELNVVKNWLDQRKFSAIGEIGIDLYWDKTHIEEQKKAFIIQIEWALEFGSPIVIHCRESFDAIYTILHTFKSLPGGIFHCFSGTLEQANKILDLGNFKLGIGGVLTYKNSGLDKVVEQIKLEHLVLETDAPYLAPAPFRGKRNEPLYIKEVAKKLAEIKKITFAEVCNVTSLNAESVFKKI